MGVCDPFFIHTLILVSKCIFNKRATQKLKCIFYTTDSAGLMQVIAGASVKERRTSSKLTERCSVTEAGDDPDISASAFSLCFNVSLSSYQ